MAVKENENRRVIYLFDYQNYEILRIDDDKIQNENFSIFEVDGLSIKTEKDM